MRQPSRLYEWKARRCKCARKQWRNVQNRNPRIGMGIDKMDSAHDRLFIPCACAVATVSLNVVRHGMH
jgi:hypothetical protein